MKNISSQIHHFITENFLFGNDEDLTSESSFLDQGILDSTGVLELINYIEENFSIKIKEDELIPENLDSINNIAKFIQTKKTANHPIEQFSD